MRLFLLWACLFPAVMAEEGDVALAGAWKASLGGGLPAAGSIDKTHLDPGMSDAAKAAVTLAFDDAKWAQVEVPSNWETYGGEWVNADGEAVFRRWVELPAGSAGKDFELCLGAIDDFDVTFVNGEQVGQVDKTVLGFWAFQRCYRIPGRLSKDGRNVIAVRVFDHFGGGGFTGPKDKLVLRPLK
jgi:sialate O-acetylesterase